MNTRTKSKFRVILTSNGLEEIKNHRKPIIAPAIAVRLLINICKNQLKNPMKNRKKGKIAKIILPHVNKIATIEKAKFYSDTISSL